MINKNYILYISYGNNINIENDFNNDSNTYMIFYEKYNKNLCDSFDNVDACCLTNDYNLCVDINKNNNDFYLGDGMLLDNDIDINLSSNSLINSINENVMIMKVILLKKKLYECDELIIKNQIIISSIII